MTPKEKAQELVSNYRHHARIERTGSRLPAAKECALIAVSEIIAALHKADTAYDLIPYINYWSEVKAEIEKL